MGLASDYRPTNREKVRAPRTGKFWCWGCDAHLVGPGEKCPACGYRNDAERGRKREAVVT